MKPGDFVSHERAGLGFVLDVWESFGEERIKIFWVKSSHRSNLFASSVTRVIAGDNARTFTTELQSV